LEAAEAQAQKAPRSPNKNSKFKIAMAKVLRIDTTWEVLTNQAWNLRDGGLYPHFIASGYELVPPLGSGTIASRQTVAPLATDGKVILITGAGHGDRDKFLGDKDEDIFPENFYDPKEVANKIVHFLACSTADNLGPNFIKNGCKAFIGYTAPFVFEPEWADIFFKCDMKVDLSLAAGNSVSQAVRDAKQEFDVEINKPSNASIVSELKNRRNTLVALGPNLEISLKSLIV
jgi:hypothetical protein